MTGSSTSSSPMASHRSRRFTTGTCRRRCKIAADGNTATPPRHSPTTPATLPKNSATGQGTFSRSTCWTFVEQGHATGVFAPGLKLPPGRLNQLRHHVLLAHGACGPGDPRAFARGHANRARGECHCLRSCRRNPRACRGSRARHPRAQCALPDRDDGRPLPRVLLGGCRRGRPKVAAGDMSVIVSGSKCRTRPQRVHCFQVRLFLLVVWRFRSRTPGPPPFSSMNSTPASSNARCSTASVASRRAHWSGDGSSV